MRFKYRVNGLVTKEKKIDPVILYNFDILVIGA